MIDRVELKIGTGGWLRDVFPAATLLSRRYLLSTLLVLVAMAVMARLGFWQLDRLEQRRARNAQLAQQLALPPLELTGAESLPDELAALTTRRVSAAGAFDGARQVALKHQNWQGAPGVHLITPLLLADGTAAVLVDRGWIPQAQAAVEQWARFDEAGPVTVTGFAHLSETLPDDTSTRKTAGPAQSAQRAQLAWYRVDIEAIQAQLPYKLLPIYIQQSPPDERSDTLPYRRSPEFDLSDGPHLGYAIQWYIFALILGLGYVSYVKKQTNPPTNQPANKPTIQPTNSPTNQPSNQTIYRRD